MGWGWGGRGMGGLERTYANFTSLTDASSHGSSLSCFFVIPYLSPSEPWTRGSSRLRVSGVTSWTFVPALEADCISYKFPSRQGSRAKLADSETMLIFKLGIQTFAKLETYRTGKGPLWTSKNLSSYYEHEGWVPCWAQALTVCWSWERSWNEAQKLWPGVIFILNLFCSVDSFFWWDNYVSKTLNFI